MANDIGLKIGLVDPSGRDILRQVQQIIQTAESVPIKINIDTSQFENIDKQTRMAMNATAKLQTANARILEAENKKVQLSNEQLKIENQLAIAKEKTLQTENRALSKMAEVESLKEKQVLSESQILLATEKTAQTKINAEAKVQVAKEKTLQADTKISLEQEKQVTATIRANTAQTKLADSSKKVADETQKSAQSFGNMILKFGQWLLIGNLVMAPIRAFREAIDELKNVDKELVSIRKVMSLTVEEANKLADSAYKMAGAFGRTASEYLSNVAEFARAGFEGQAESLAQLAMLAQNVGDIDSELASKMLIVANVAWDMKGNIHELTKVVDIFNEVSNRTPATVEKLSRAMQVSGNVFGQAGVTVEKYTAILATAIEATGDSGEKIGTAMRTALLRIMQIKDAVDEETGEMLSDVEFAKAEEALDKWGITIRGVGGSMRNFYDIMADIASVWKTKNEQQQMELLGNISTVRQVNALIGVFNNWDKVLQNVEIAENAAGSAAKENAIYLDSWEAKAKKLSATWTEFIAKSLDTGVIKVWLDLLTGLIKLFNNLGSTIMVVAGILIAFNSASIIGAFSKLSNAIGSTITAMFNLGKAATATQAAFGWIGIAVAAIGLITMAIGNSNRAQEESAQKTREAAQEYTASTVALQGYIQNLEKLYEQRDSGSGDAIEINKQILKLQDDIRATIGKQAEGLDLVNGKSKENLAIVTDIYIQRLKDNQELLRSAVLLAEQEAKKGFGEGFFDQIKREFNDLTNEIPGRLRDVIGFDFGFGAWNAPVEYLKGIKDTEEQVATLRDWLVRLNDAQAENQKLVGEGKAEEINYGKAIGFVTGLLSEYDKKQQSVSNATNELNKSLATTTLYDTFGIAIVKTQEDFDKLVQNIKENKDIKIGDLGLEETQKFLIQTATAMTGFGEIVPEISNKISILSEVYKTLEDAVKGVNDVIDETQSTFKTLSDAVDEYNETGGFSIDTMQKLVALGTDYTDLLVYEDGQVRLVANAQELFTEKIKEQAQALVVSSALKDLEARTTKAMEDASKDAKTSVIEVGNALETAGGQASKAAEGLLQAASAANLLAGAEGAGVDTKKWAEDWAKNLEILNKLELSSFGTGAKKPSKTGGGGTTKPEDTWKKEFDDWYKVEKHKVSMGLETERDFTEKLDMMYKKYFSNKTKYLDEYNKYELNKIGYSM